MMPKLSEEVANGLMLSPSYCGKTYAALNGDDTRHSDAHHVFRLGTPFARFLALATFHLEG